MMGYTYPDQQWFEMINSDDGNPSDTYLMKLSKENILRSVNVHNDYGKNKTIVR